MVSAERTGTYVDASDASAKVDAIGVKVVGADEAVTGWTERADSMRVVRSRAACALHICAENPRLWGQVLV